ncbi:hypothetical protein RUM43_014938 [Polyplax serrata]|uniref:CLIP domain-containing serine protease n=1 Tax=Polyplax serrata TaxID=468196 RepID=A0AAN8PGC3_POLSC
MLSLRFIVSIIVVFRVGGPAVAKYSSGEDNETTEEWDSSSEIEDHCLTPSGTQGICRKIINCKLLLRFLIKNKSKPNSRVIDFLRRSHCGFDGIHPVVCCPLLSGSEESQGRVNLKQEFNNTNKTELTCGLISSANKIVGGSAAGLSEFPWMALIGYETKHGLQYRCGGSLVSSHYVLTAAHCVSTLKEISPKTVRLGEHNMLTEEDCENGFGCAPPPVDIPIHKVIPHPEYSRPNLRNDIALIRLAEKVKLGEFIRPICLPLNDSLDKRILQKEKAIVTGWGTTETGIRSHVLLKATLPIVSRPECLRAYKNKVPITDTQICAGGEAGKDSCSGDSGGPLQVIELNHLGEPAYVQKGIVSFGPRNCGTEGIPAVYTRVSRYVDWILMNLKN